MARRGRASVYSPKLGEAIAGLVAEGKGLGAASEQFGVPRRTARNWIAQHGEFEIAYERARREWADGLVDEIVALLDGVLGSDSQAAVTAARNAADGRRWLAAKLLPGRFGDRLVQEITGRDGAPLIPDDPPDQGKIALAILNLLHGAGGGRNKPAPVIENEPAALPPEPVDPATSETFAGLPPSPLMMTPFPPEPWQPMPVQRMSQRAADDVPSGRRAADPAIDAPWRSASIHELNPYPSRYRGGR